MRCEVDSGGTYCAWSQAVGIKAGVCYINISHIYQLQPAHRFISDPEPICDLVPSIFLFFLGALYRKVHSSDRDLHREQAFPPSELIHLIFLCLQLSHGRIFDPFPLRPLSVSACMDDMESSIVG